MTAVLRVERSADVRRSAGRLLRHRRLAAIGFLAPSVIFIGLFFGYPLFNNISLSVRDYTVQSFYTGQAPLVGAENYRAMWSDPLFATSMRNTALFTVGSIVFQFTIGLALAAFFVRRFPLSRAIRALLLLPWLLPLVVSGAVWRWILDQDHGVLNTFLEALHVTGNSGIGWLSDPSWALFAVTLTNIWIGIPFNLVILYGGLQAIPETLYEAAELDGAGAWHRFRYITWPLLRPVTGVVLMLGIVYTIKVFDIIQVMTAGGPANSTQVLTTWSYKLSFTDFRFGEGAAVGNVLIAIAIVFGLVYLRSVKRSMAATS